jgi:predicted DNA-binding ribbon-helix-helix protein
LGANAADLPVSAAPWLRKRSISLSGHRTSVALETEFWRALETIATHDGCTLSALIAQIDRDRDPLRPLASALRVYALQHAGREQSRNCDVPECISSHGGV